MSSPTIKQRFFAVRNILRDAARSHFIDPWWMYVIARVESGFDPNAFNAGSHAAGLFQIIPSTAVEWNVENPLDPIQASTAVAREIKRLTIRFAADGIPQATLSFYMVHQQGYKGWSEIYDSYVNGTPLKAARIRNMLSNLPKSIARQVDDPGLSAKEKATMFVTWWDKRIERAYREIASWQIDS